MHPNQMPGTSQLALSSLQISLAWAQPPYQGNSFRTLILVVTTPELMSIDDGWDVDGLVNGELSFAFWLSSLFSTMVQWNAYILFSIFLSLVNTTLRHLTSFVFSGTLNFTIFGKSTEILHGTVLSCPYSTVQFSHAPPSGSMGPQNCPCKLDPRLTPQGQGLAGSLLSFFIIEKDCRVKKHKQQDTLC